MFPLLILVYLALSRLGLSLALGETNATPVWPPSGFSVAILILFGRKFWPVVFTGALITNLVYYFSNTETSVFVAIAASFGIAIGNTLESLIATRILEVFRSGKILSSVRSFGVFLFAASLGSIVASTTGSFIISSHQFFDSYAYSSMWFTWFLGDLSGIVVLTPLIMIWFNEPERYKNNYHPWVIVTTMFVFALYLVLLFNEEVTEIFNSKIYHFFLFGVWCAFCMSYRQLSVVLLMIVVASVYFTLQFKGPFIANSQNDSLLSLQLFLCIATVTTIFLSIALHERKQTEEYFRKVNAELEKTKSELEETMKVKDRFVANMSHEIRTPMNAILGFTDLMLQSDLNPEQKQYMQSVRHSGDSLLVIINDILDYSRIKSGKIVFEETNFELSKLLSELIELIFPKAMDKEIVLSFQVDENVPDQLKGDPVRLTQILLNLVSNAVKFTSKGSVKLSVGLIANNENIYELQFKVEDTGIGISESKLPFIFDEFTQENSATTRKYGGSGLGLTIVKELVELRGGKISVESEVGKGTRFMFNLKFRKSEAKHEEIPNHDYFSNKSLGLKVLVVEDHILNQMLVEKILRNWSCDVDIVDNGKSAIERLQHKDYDIVLMDIQLPEMDGYEATRFIRNNLGERGKQFRIIALTAHAMIGEAEKCFRAGMNAYLTKPFNPDLLYKKIQRLMNMRSDFEGASKS